MTPARSAPARIDQAKDPMRAVRWITTLAYAGVIFYLSSRAWNGTSLFPHADKLLHLLVYAGLGALCVWALEGTSLRGRAQIFPLAAAMAFLYGVTDEMHQMLVPGREASLADLIFDGIGAAAGARIAWSLAIRSKGRRGNEV